MSVCEAAVGRKFWGNFSVGSRIFLEFVGHVGFSLDDVDGMDEVFAFSPLRESYA